MTYPRYTPIVDSLPPTVPFVGPETQERTRGQTFRARLGANESVFGPSPHAIEAMRAHAGEVWMYGDPENHDLRAALGEHHGVDKENVVVGEGIDGLLGYLVRLVVGPGDSVVTSEGAYPTFNYHVAGFGGALHKVPYLNDHEDPDALIAKAVDVGAKLVYLANPDNPMGSWHRGSELAKRLKDLPEGCLLVLDEAYVECAPEGTALPIDVEDPRVIRMRTFSKIYGMAGMRVGYALGATELIASFNKVRNHFGVNRMAQVGALAALHDQDWLRHVQSEIESSRLRLSEIADANGLTPLPSATNFVTMDCGADAGFAQSVMAGLIARDIFVRMPFAAPQNRCIRVSCGPEDLIDIFAEELPKVLADLRG